MHKNATSSSKKHASAADPPKRPVTSFIRFSNELRDQVKKKNPELAQKEVLKVIGAEWKKLSEAQKKKYEDAYTKDRAKYEVELKAYEDKYGPVKTNKAKAKKSESKESKDNTKRGRKSTKGK